MTERDEGGLARGRANARPATAVGGLAARALLLALALVLVPAPPVVDGWTVARAWAQDEESAGEPAGHRKWLYALAGGAIFAVPALIAQPPSTGPCTSRACTTGFGAAAGVTLGFMIGRERDQAAARRYAGGPSLSYESEAIGLTMLPERVEPFDGGAVVLGRRGLAVVQPGGTMWPRGGGLRGIRAAASFPGRDLLLAGTAAGIYAFPLRGQTMEDGRLVLNQTGTSMLAVAAGELLLGGSDLLRRLRLSGGGTGVTLTEETQAASPGIFTDMARSSFTGVTWVLSDDVLRARSGTGLEEIGRVTLPASGRSLSLSGSRALVAAGSEGLFLVDVSQPESPRLVGHVQGIRFAFDAVLDGSTAYVAAGRIGLLVVDLNDPSNPETLGVIRDVGFANAVARAPDGRFYVVDQEGRRLIVMEPNLRD